MGRQRWNLSRKSFTILKYNLRSSFIILEYRSGKNVQDSHRDKIICMPAPFYQHSFKKL
jgi:hypothetical protein